MNSGLNEYTLEYPSGLIDAGYFRICVTTESDDWYNCGEGYNSREKKPESVFVNLVTGDSLPPRHSKSVREPESGPEPRPNRYCVSRKCKVCD
jgi:hypothetical protein